MTNALAKCGTPVDDGKCPVQFQEIPGSVNTRSLKANGHAFSVRL
jgi:hypothetical protein